MRKFERPGIVGWMHEPEGRARAAMLLSHGAGSGCDAPLMVAVAEAFEKAGYLVLRWDLPFRQERRSPGPSVQAKDREGIRTAAEVLRELAPGTPVILAGHSYGGRQSSMLAADNPLAADALLLLSYPLHPKGQPEKLRVEHFPSLRTPALFVHGTKDPFGAIQQLETSMALIAGRKKLIAIEGAKHGLPFPTAPLLPAWLDEFRAG